MVEFSSSLLFGTGIQEFENIVDVERMRRERNERLRETMKKHDMAVCLLTRGDNVRYAAGTAPAPLPPQLNYCLFSVEQDTVAWDFPGGFSRLLRPGTTLDLTPQGFSPAIN